VGKGVLRKIPPPRCTDLVAAAAAACAVEAQHYDDDVWALPHPEQIFKLTPYLRQCLRTVHQNLPPLQHLCAKQNQDGLPHFIVLVIAHNFHILCHHARHVRGILLFTPASSFMQTQQQPWLQLPLRLNPKPSAPAAAAQQRQFGIAKNVKVSKFQAQLQ
jgi:hypothetical protein